MLRPRSHQLHRTLPPRPWLKTISHFFRIKITVPEYSNTKVHCVLKNRTRETFHCNFAKIAKNWYTQPAYDVIKLQYYKTYITLSPPFWTTSKLNGKFNDLHLRNGT